MISFKVDFSKSVLFLFFTLLLLNFSFAQNTGEIHGNIQVDAQYYNPDSAIGAPAVPEKTLMNGFANLIYTNGDFSAGVRYESYLNVLQGFPVDYKGNGIPYRFVSYKADELEVTVGNFYDQFGNGLIFRSYEERGLGYDNAMDGIRIKYNPYKGLFLKGLIGKQRLYFTQGPGIVRGFDAELQLNEVIEKLGDKKTKVILGGSFVSKFQDEQSTQFVLPQNVGSSAFRLNLIHGTFNLNTEYAYKINDPSADNGFIYKPGHSLLVMASYYKNNLGITLNAKQIDNMSFRSDRNAAINDLLINYSPALCKQHTYSLLSFYPYASQPNGEVAFQAELEYKFKKGTKLGGAYGMDFLINYSGANALNKTILNDLDSSRMGYKTNNFQLGKTIFFRDFVFELNRKFSKKLKASLIYANQIFNIDVVQGKPGQPNILSHIVVLDATYKLTSDRAIRTELQHLQTKQDMGSWAFALAELTIGSHWFLAIQDQYNYGNPKNEKRFHYVYGTVGYVKKATRISLSYGKQRAGVFCVGGICRVVPASNGIALSITNSF